MTANEPIGRDEFAAIMRPFIPFEKNATIAAAVSGGADSMALCLLLNDWAQTNGSTVIAVTIDHGLRPESANEAAQVGAWMRERNIAHHIVPWRHTVKPDANIQEQARKARYGLLNDFCKTNHILHLCAGHHQNDSAENFLIRLSRGSGVYGLSATDPVSYLQNARLLRPLLNIPKSRLTATLQSAHQNWIEDPSNDNDDYTRIQFRKHQEIFSYLGLTPERLHSTAQNMRRARIALESQTAIAAAKSMRIDPMGFAVINAAMFCGFDDEIGMRLLAGILACIGGRDYPPRLHSLQHLYDAIQDTFKTNGASWPKTLSGCIVDIELKSGEKTILVCREYAAAQNILPIARESGMIWDGRFLIEWTSPPAQSGLYLSYAGENGWAQAVADCPDLREQTRNYSHTIKCGLPAVFNASPQGVVELVAIPQLNYWKKGALDLSEYGFRIVFYPQYKITNSAGFI